MCGRARLAFVIFIMGLTANPGSAANAATWNASVDFRTRYQSFSNHDFNSSANDDRWKFDNRLYLKAASDLGHGFSAWLQPQAIFIIHPADISQMTPSPASPHGKALVTWEDRTLAGAYGTFLIRKKTGLDAYFINWRHNQRAAVGKGRNIQTFGARAFARWRGFDATAEAAFQRDTWKNGVSQNASAFAAKAGYSLDFWHTRIGIEYDFSPGDDKTDPATHKNFVFPFHTNHMHYGEMDFFSWANMKDFRISLRTSPVSGLTFTGNVHFLSLDKARGDWLNVVGTGAGTEVDLKAIYKTPRIPGLTLVAQYALFNPGAAVAERNGDRADTARFAYAFARYVF